MKKTFDWQGNEIKEGDEICIIIIRNVSMFGEVSFMDDQPYEKRPFKPLFEPYDCWETNGCYKVFEDKGELWVAQKIGEWTVNLKPGSELFYDNQEGSILAIKGVSDDENEYRNKVSKQ